MQQERWMYILSFLGVTALSLLFTKILFYFFSGPDEDDDTAAPEATLPAEVPPP